jgi:hypothetical protein
MKEKRRRKDNPGVIAFGDLSYNRRDEGRRGKVIIDSIPSTIQTNKKTKLIKRRFIRFLSLKLTFFSELSRFCPFSILLMASDMTHNQTIVFSTAQVTPLWDC